MAQNQTENNIYSGNEEMKEPQNIGVNQIDPQVEFNTQFEQQSNITIAFLGKTGAGKTTLMNALARKELNAQAKPGQLSSETAEVAVFQNIPFLGKTDSKLVNFVDVPGLQDTDGRDQMILDNMVEELRDKI